MDFSILSRAGVTTQQFAKLLGVSRISVHAWKSGTASPRPTNRRKVSAALKQLDEAVARGELPVPSTYARAYTENTLQRILSTAPAAA